MEVILVSRQTVHPDRRHNPLKYFDLCLAAVEEGSTQLSSTPLLAIFVQP